MKVFTLLWYSGTMQQRRLSRLAPLFLPRRHQHPPLRRHPVVRGTASDELKLPRSARDSRSAFHMQLFRWRSMSSKPYASSSLCKDDEDMSSSQPTCITFLTDVEGDGAYLDRFICHSKLLGFRSVTPSFGRYGKRRYGKPEHKCDGETWNLGQYDEEYFPYDKEIVFLDDVDGNGSRNSLLVYGGDIWDKGGSDLYVLRQLLSLFRRYPRRVHFLMGNRDINKMRIVDELVCGIKDEALPHHGGAYWLMRGGPPADPDRSAVPSESAAERVKWMLKMTMGSVDAFELRRNELMRERFSIRKAIAVIPSRQPEHTHGDESIAETISDDEVAQSYIHSCCPVSGIMSQYLSHAKLVLRVGPVLFLHGALPIVLDDQPVHFPTPWLHGTDDGTQSGSKSLTEWISALDDFASKQVEAWKEYGRCFEDKSNESSGGVWATKGGYFNSSRAGKMFGALIQYGMGTLPDRAITQSCVYNSWMHDGLPRDDMFGNDESMRKLYDLLEQEGIQIILSGHQPVGDAPWPIQISTSAEKAKAWILPCDTSFSGDTCWTSLEGYHSLATQNDNNRAPASGGRGEVVFSVNSLKIHGRLSDGSYYESNNMMILGEEDYVTTLGRKKGHFEFEDYEAGDKKEGMFWMKGVLGGKVLVSFGKGYNVWNSYISLD